MKGIIIYHVWLRFFLLIVKGGLLLTLAHFDDVKVNKIKINTNICVIFTIANESFHAVFSKEKGRNCIMWTNVI